jgi:N-acylglucosamine 2-epimerase
MGMNANRIKRLKGFYEYELCGNILSFWLPRCQDKKHGGFFNCYDNTGKTLVSHDKYTWSQGRFVWMFSKLAGMESDTFTLAQREEFLSLAKGGADFLVEHCLVGKDDWRCAFLMDETGAHKKVRGCDDLDMSIYADCFVVSGLARYAAVSREQEYYIFAKNLYASCLERLENGTFKTLPYPLSGDYRAHGIPMIFSNVAAELFRASLLLDMDHSAELLSDLRAFTQSILCDFTDENNVVHEVIRKEGGFFDDLLGQHANPGHTLEDMWFTLEAASLLADNSMAEKAAEVAKKALVIGWDEEFGGILHFASPFGGPPKAAPGNTTCEPVTKQVEEGWGDKLWWVHSEALYTTLLFYCSTNDDEFMQWHDRVFNYTFSHFPNPDREVREWVQILGRDGRPLDKVVALPVKDSYHIVRNLVLLIELLERVQKNEKPA